MVNNFFFKKKIYVISFIILTKIMKIMPLDYLSREIEFDISVKTYNNSRYYMLGHSF
jgi:hypothetical protein